MSCLDDLPWFLREYIHASRWTGFREVQLEAFRILFGTDNHLVISSGTSGGKTEAALFPIIASLYRDPPDGVGALYIGPLKALINDQRERLEEVLGESGIRAEGWHGDIARSAKDRAVRDPPDILQITPESLQGILTNRPEQAAEMFRSLRFVVIDEMHAFMGTDRGDQLVCCLSMLERVAGCRPRRIGLSATLPDRTSAEEWISFGDGGASTVRCFDGRGATITIEYNRFPQADPSDGGRSRAVAVNAYYRRLLEVTDGCSCIVFSNSRISAERTASSLSKVSERAGSRCPVMIHHGSVSQELRSAAEDALKSGSGATVVSTSTLELGIDVGDLDRVVQIDPPHSCSSMVQRLGRSGRRGGAPEMVVFCNEDSSKWWSSVEGVYFDLVKAEAMAQLAEEGWTEPAPSGRLPYGLLYQQTLSYLKTRLDVRFTELADAVLGMPPFRGIQREEYKGLVRHMASIGHLQILEDMTIIIGTEGDRVVHDRDFGAVFSDGDGAEVVCGGKQIGTVQKLPDVGGKVMLAGRTWRVVSVSDSPMRAEVVEDEGDAVSPWGSGCPMVHGEVMRRMRDILVSGAPAHHLDGAGMGRLEACRAAARASGMGELVTAVPGGFALHLWVGSAAFDTLRRIISRVKGVRAVRAVAPYVMYVRTDLDPDSVLRSAESLRLRTDPESLVGPEDDQPSGRYDAYLPAELRRRAFAAEMLDIEGCRLSRRSSEERGSSFPF